MKKQSIKKVLEHAKHTCAEQGGRLTPKRQHILELLLSHSTPLSAYEIADAYKDNYKESIAPMSVYRMLEFLMSADLVHKLSSTNKFIACTHISCDHSHKVPQFLICDACDSVEEVNIDAGLVKGLQQAVADKSFTLCTPQFELHGVCSQCQKES